MNRSGGPLAASTAQALAECLRPARLPRGCGMLMTTRLGGPSSGDYASRNLSLDVGDDAAAVLASRAWLAATTGAVPVFLRQVHGARVVRLDRRSFDAATEAADASVSDCAGVACVVQAEDCLPVLFAAADGRAVGAAHAGWRGLAGGVLEATVAAVCELARCPPAGLVAWLGACIGPRHFEVGADVLAAFGVDAAEEPRFVATRPGKWLADLPGLARDRLAAAGVITVEGGECCTFADRSRFFSYRRDGRTGRMAAAVWIDSRRGVEGGDVGA